MDKRFLSMTVISIIAILFAGCATSLPLTSTLNDFVILGIKTNGTVPVTFNFTSTVQDGLIKPYEKDRLKEIAAHAGFNHTESATLNRMLNEYMGNKFANIVPSGSTVIKAELKEFWIEQYSTDSMGMQVLAAFGGGEMNSMCVAKLKMLLSINHNGEVFTKILSATAEDSFIQGYGTGTSTSNIYRGADSIQHVHARNINNVNNKLIMMMNAYFEEIGL